MNINSLCGKAVKTLQQRTSPPKENGDRITRLYQLLAKDQTCPVYSFRSPAGERESLKSLEQRLWKQDGPLVPLEVKKFYLLFFSHPLARKKLPKTEDILSRFSKAFDRGMEVPFLEALLQQKEHLQLPPVQEFVKTRVIGENTLAKWRIYSLFLSHGAVSSVASFLHIADDIRVPYVMGERKEIHRGLCEELIRCASTSGLSFSESQKLALLAPLQSHLDHKDFVARGEQAPFHLSEETLSLSYFGIMLEGLVCSDSDSDSD